MPPTVNDNDLVPVNLGVSPYASLVSPVPYLSSNSIVFFIVKCQIPGNYYFFVIISWSNQLDFFMLNETWLSSGDCVVLNNTHPPGFIYFHQPKLSGHGGDMAMIHTYHFKCSPSSLGNFPSFE